MRLEQRLEQELSLKQELRIDFGKVISHINDYFSKAEASNDVNMLKELLRVVPQKQNGQVAYVVAGGWAVEILSGKSRPHGNINVLVMDPEKQVLESHRCLDYLGVLYLDKALDRALVKRDVIEADWKRGHCKVYVPSPEFMIGTKLLPRSAVDNPRGKDMADVITMLKAYSPRKKFLAKVFRALPYVRDPETVAEYVSETARYVRTHPKDKKAGVALELLTCTLKEQVFQYRQKQTFKEWKLTLKGSGLTGRETKTLYDYFEKESSSDDFKEWFEENRSKLLNTDGRLYHPKHPDDARSLKHAWYKEHFTEPEGGKFEKALVFADGSVMRDDPEIVEEIFADTKKHSGSSLVYTIQEKKEAGSQKCVWGPSGRLIYENWKKV